METLPSASYRLPVADRASHPISNRLGITIPGINPEHQMWHADLGDSRSACVELTRKSPSRLRGHLPYSTKNRGRRENRAFPDRSTVT
jgi:hypothetical protein